MAAAAVGSTEPGFVHEALFYEDEPSFLDGVVPFLREGLTNGEPMLVALDQRKIGLLHEALGEAAKPIVFVDMAVLGANPARIIPAWREFASARPPGTPVRGIGEPIWAGRSPDELVECQLHEELLNVAFADEPAFELLCPYDTRELPPHVLEGARRSHPHLIDGGRRTGSSSYCGLHAAASPCADPLPELGEPAVEFSFDAELLSHVRSLVDGVTLQLGVPVRRRRDFVLAVNEMAANSVRHGGGTGTVRVWTLDGRVVCDVTDAGHIADPLVGRRKPRPLSPNGYGVWLANQVCDLVQIRSTGTGSVVRLHLHV